MTIAHTRLRLLALAALLSWGTLAQAGHAGGHGRQLEQGLAPEDRMRLQRDLHDYSDHAYPDRERLQQSRQEMRERLQQRFERADREGRHGISRDEARQNMPWVERRFERIDRDGDGIISRDEADSAHEHRR